jgi:homoserine dehydrogenase
MRVDLALVGFGHVGRRFAELLRERHHTLHTHHGLDCRIVGIATLRHGATFSADGVDVDAALAAVPDGRPLDAAGNVTTAREVIDRLSQSPAPLRVMVETTTLSIADGQPAIEHVDMAFDRRCHVVTANKGPVAFAYRRLRDRARGAGVMFRFESAVMDGVPIFNLARETMPAMTFHGFTGVINSTTNHILSALEDGHEYAPALARMQAEGIAEADPSLDIDGWDAAAKTAALANVLLDGHVTPLDVQRTGIGPECAARARLARQRGERLRLVASAARSDAGDVTAEVRLIELAGDSLLAGLRGTANALILHTDLLGDVAIQQLWGNVTMTAYGLLSDLIAIRRSASPLDEGRQLGQQK